MSEQSSSLELKENSRLWPTLTVCAAAAPVLLILFLILRYAVAIPMLDDWEMVPLVTKAHTGGLTFTDLFEQQQESRTFFPKLLFIVLAMGKHWDSRIEMMLSVLICCLTALGIYQLLGKAGLSARAKAIVCFLIVLLLFSPAQHELWLLASGFPSFVPALCIVWGLRVVASELSLAAKFWICVALAFFASFTLANGLLAWGLTFPVVIVAQREPRWKRWLGFWFMAIAACAAIYFWHFRAQKDLPSFAPHRSPLEYLQYLAAFLGSGLGRSGNAHPLAVSSAIGTVLLLGYLAGLGYFVFRCRDREYCTRVAPWIALGAYSIGSGCLAALGRIAWGVSQALESRYVTFSLYLTVAIIALGTIFTKEFLETRRPPRRRLGAVAVAIFLGASYLTFELLCAAGSIPFFRLRSAAARLGQSGLLFSQVLNTSKAIQNGNYPRAYFARQNAEELDGLHLLRTPLVRSREINRLRHADTGEGMASGWCDGLTAAGSDESTVWGWAALTGRHRPADAVVLAYADERGEWIAFALSDAVLERPDVVQVLHDSEQLWSGWRAGFARGALPKGAEISAWAVDAKEAKLYRLKAKERMFNL